MKEILPKGFRAWKKVSVFPIGHYSIFAYRNGQVGIFTFNGEDMEPIEVRLFDVIKK